MIDSINLSEMKLVLKRGIKCFSLSRKVIIQKICHKSPTAVCLLSECKVQQNSSKSQRIFTE